MQTIERENARKNALERAQSGGVTRNYETIYREFAGRGIPAADIQPRVNVLTFHAWLALGRKVKRGEHGVKVLTYISMTKKDDDSGEKKPIGRHARGTTVFHVSQTESV